MEKEKEAIRQAIDCYVQGSYRADRNLLKRAFQQDAKMYGIMRGQYVMMDAAAFIDSLCSSRSMEEEGVDFCAEVDITTVCGNVAAVVVQEHNFGGAMDFTDLFQLVKTNEGWKIVSKAFC